MPTGPGGDRFKQVEVTVDIVGAPTHLVRVALQDLRIQGVTQIDILVAPNIPTSARTGELTVAVELGHCGLGSVIDVDGGYWDPVGFVPDHPDAINAASGVFSLIGPNTGSNATEGGLIIQLIRHPGPKHLPPCD